MQNVVLICSDDGSDTTFMENCSLRFSFQCRSLSHISTIRYIAKKVRLCTVDLLMIFRSQRLLPSLLNILSLGLCRLAGIILDLCVGWHLFLTFMCLAADFLSTGRANWGLRRTRVGSVGMLTFQASRLVDGLRFWRAGDRIAHVGWLSRCGIESRQGGVSWIEFSHVHSQRLSNLTRCVSN